MNVKSFLKRAVLGFETIARVSSNMNGEILVREDLFGRREMVIGKVCQSGGLVRTLWKSIFNSQFILYNKFSKHNFHCLILGLGAGTLAKLITEKLPKTKVTGVEIDPKVVEIGQKYFDLNKIPNLEIIVGDAFEEIYDLGFKIYDLVLVDLYKGQEFPAQAESDEFLKKIKSILAKDGLVIFNRLYFNRQHRQKADAFLKKVRQIYPFVKVQKAVTNLLILASFEAKNKI